MKKRKNNKRDLYNFEIEEEKEKKVKKQKKKAKEKTSKQINPQNEIIIGVTTYPSIKDKNKKQKTKDKKIKSNKPKITMKIIKWTSLPIIFIGIIIFAILSPIFNVTQIIVKGNTKVTQEEITNLSKINIQENIFKQNLKKAKEQIKQNGYVEDVNIKRILPDKIEINIKEREATFIIEFGNGYIYINNQGYILEISNQKLDLPIITGITTTSEQIKEGNRLNKEDLKKLGTVLKIMATANVKNIDKLITSIDITDSSNYTLYFKTEQKKAYLGDCSNLETRMLYLASILEKERGNPGEIFVNIDLNTDDAFFRESV